MTDRPAGTDTAAAVSAEQRRLRPSEIFATLKSPLIYRNFLVHIFVMIPSTIFLAYLAILLDGTFGWSRFATLGARLGPAIVMFAAGATIVVYCYAYLLLIGDGSPGSHLGGPKHLVASGPYALVRHPSVIGKLLGHSQTQTTARYAHLMDSPLRAGVDAVASHTLVPNQKATAEEIIAAADKAELDTILVTRYVGEKADQVYHPGTVYYAVTPAYDPGYYGNFGGYYGRATEVAYQQPVWTENVSHAMISDLYAAKTQDRLWQAVSETIESSGSKQVMKDAVDALIGNLKEKGLLN